MTPETATFLGSLVDRFGLPMVLLALIVLAVYRRWFVTRGELDDKQAELDKMSALFEREREDRIAAQKGMAEVASASANVAESIELVMGVYSEREQGTVKRAR